MRGIEAGMVARRVNLPLGLRERLDVIGAARYFLRWT